MDLEDQVDVRSDRRSGSGCDVAGGPYQARDRHVLVPIGQGVELDGGEAFRGRSPCVGHDRLRGGALEEEVQADAIAVPTTEEVPDGGRPGADP